MKENRIFATEYPRDWERYTFVETVYHPKNVSARELDEAIYELRHTAATVPWVWRRTLRTLVNTRSITAALFVHGMNKGWKRLAQIQTRDDRVRFGGIPEAAAERIARLRQAFALG
jgi:hypothetical protein